MWWTDPILKFVFNGGGADKAQTDFYEVRCLVQPRFPVVQGSGCLVVRVFPFLQSFHWKNTEIHKSWFQIHHSAPPRCQRLRSRGFSVPPLQSSLSGRELSRSCACLLDARRWLSPHPCRTIWFAHSGCAPPPTFSCGCLRIQARWGSRSAPRDRALWLWRTQVFVIQTWSQSDALPPLKPFHLKKRLTNLIRKI